MLPVHFVIEFHVPALEHLVLGVVEYCALNEWPVTLLFPVLDHDRISRRFDHGIEFPSDAPEIFQSGPFKNKGRLAWPR